MILFLVLLWGKSDSIFLFQTSLVDLIVDDNSLLNYFLKDVRVFFSDNLILDFILQFFIVLSD